MTQLLVITGTNSSHNDCIWNGGGGGDRVKERDGLVGRGNMGWEGQGHGEVR